MKAFIKLILLACLIPFSGVVAQESSQYSSSQIQLDLKKMNILGNVLYIAAHPDDENTRLISWLAKEKLVNTAYLSLTRGDGGQNLVGPELNELLGVTRTQELLQARKIDGGVQYFSRAKDFGFSKNPDETFTIWDREKVLSDVVWVIRKFRPDVIITRFNTESGRTHGHHTASAILAEEAFTAAADKNKFPEQLKWVDAWQPKRLLWNTTSWFYASEKDFKTESLIKIDVGQYNTLLGKSYTEIAAESRSMHKSQGFGTAGSRGSSLEYLDHKLGSRAEKDVFEGIDLTWSRINGGSNIEKIIQRARESFNPSDPSGIIDILLEAKEAVSNLSDDHWKKIKTEELNKIIKSCLGLYLESTTTEVNTTPGQSAKISIELINRSAVPVEVKSIKYSLVGKDTSLSSPLKENIGLNYSTKITIPENADYSSPYWLRENGTIGMFTVSDQQKIGLPENPPAIQVTYAISIKGKDFIYSTPLVYKKADPVKGVIYRPFEITPPVFINITEGPYVFADEKAKIISVKLKSGRTDIKGSLSLSIPPGWKAEPASVNFNIKEKGREDIFYFKVTPSKAELADEIKAVANVDGKNYDQGIIEINYEHIPAQTLLPDASVKTVKINLKRKGENIGYIMGAGDEIPQALAQVGYKVTLLKEEQISAERLKQFDAVIMGIRAYNTLPKLKFYQPHLMNYVKNGGTLIVQYNTAGGRFLQNGIQVDSIGPYPLKLSNERVTVEDAPVTLLIPEHPVLNTPNKISQKDFENWVQERGLYFPNEWSKEYAAPLSTNDPGEIEKKGGLLIAKYGKGSYIYTAYSWFRELPAGVPGAYRIFTNLISIGK